MSVEDRAVNLYYGDRLIKDAVPVPIGYLIPNEPMHVAYTLRNDTDHTVYLHRDGLPEPLRWRCPSLGVGVTHPNGIVKLVTEPPTTLAPHTDTPLIIQWLITDPPKIYGNEKLKSATLRVDAAVLMEGRIIGEPSLRE
jgi:hypothetical protein